MDLFWCFGVLEIYVFVRLVLVCVMCDPEADGTNVMSEMSWKRARGEWTRPRFGLGERLCAVGRGPAEIRGA